MKHVILACFFVGLLILLVQLSSHASFALMNSSSSAQTTPPLGKERTSSSSANTQASMDSLKARADQEIDRRVASLNTVIVRINSLKHIPDADKTTLAAKAQDQITSLTALKAKIDADTDMTILKTDVRSIVDSYRVYALLIPQIHMLAAADTMLEGVTKGNNVASKLQIKITEAKAAGKDVTALQTALSDMQAKLKDASVQATTVVVTVMPLTPEGYPGNKTTLMTAKNALQKGVQDIRMAIQDAKTIIKGLRPEKEMKPGTGSARLEKPATHSATATRSASQF